LNPITKIKDLYGKIPIKEPYKTALGIALIGSTSIAITYLLLPNKIRLKLREKVFRIKSNESNNL
jgi:hypothetical protein